MHLHESGGRCRLSLAGLTHGEGSTLQEAADDLVLRLLNLILTFHASERWFSSELRAPDPRLMQFIWELGERAANGEDMRERLFGSTN